MPAAKTKSAAKKAAKQKSFEETLWDTATKLRGSVESSDWSGATKTTRQGCPEGERGGAHQYKHVVLSLIFLKFVSDKFEERRAELVAEGKEDYLDMVDWSGATERTRQGCPQGERGGAHQFYTMQNVFYLPETSRWSYIQQQAKQGGGRSEIGMQKEEVNDEGRKRSQGAHQAVCAANYPPVRKPAEIDRGTDSGQTVTSLGDIRRGQLSRGSSWTEQSRVHREMRRLTAGTRGIGVLAGTPRRWRNCASRQAPTAPRRVRRTHRHLRHNHQTSPRERQLKSEGRLGKEELPPLLHSSFSLQTFPLSPLLHSSFSLPTSPVTATTYKLAKMNLAVRGLSANLGEVPADTFFKDQHPDLKADTATRGRAIPFQRRSQTAGRPRSGGQHMANPPFNLKDWRGPDTAMRGSANLQPEGTPQVTSEARNKLVHDGRWKRFAEGVEFTVKPDRFTLFPSANLASAN